MLIYNYQKEFIGIDESNLKALGFSSLSQLIDEVDDFADLFVKTPGYIHNFKHVHWIDFVTCAESNQESKVIINVNGKNFRCNLDVKGFYLKDDPSNMGYAVKLVNLRTLSQGEQKPALGASDLVDIIEDDYEEEIEKEYLPIEEDELQSDGTISIDDFDRFEDPVRELNDEPLDLEYETTQEIKEIKKEPLAPLYSKVLEVGSDYVYDPQLASDELGLPLELIEEFVQDFIAQAKDFKADLYSSLSDQNIDNVKILSHKLKGVAANLRIEDAFEVLTTVNSSEDLLEIKQSLDMFYEMVDRLANKKEPKEQIPKEENSQSEVDQESEGDMVLSFKDEDEIKDADVPQMIEMPELADDEFISLELDEDIYEPEDEVEIEEFEDDEEEAKVPEEEASEIEILQEEIEIQEDKQVQYDRVKAANEIGIDIENFNELFSDFLDEAKAYTSQIGEALQESDFEASKSSSIKLKRMCETMRIESFDEEIDSIIKAEDQSTIERAIAAIDTKLNLISSMEA